MAVGKTNINTGGGNLPLTVQAADVRLGKTFTRDCKTVESGTLNLSNLKAENIKSGVNIAGIIGELPSLEGGKLLINTNSGALNDRVYEYDLPANIKVVVVFLSSGKMQYHFSPVAQILGVKSRMIRYNIACYDDPWVEINGKKYVASYDTNISQGGDNVLVIFGF